MSQKTYVWLGMSVGSIIGGMIPNLWDAGLFSLSGTFFAAIGGFLGIYIGFKMAQ